MCPYRQVLVFRLNTLSDRCPFVQSIKSLYVGSGYYLIDVGGVALTLSAIVAHGSHGSLEISCSLESK